ncbi:MAG: hypothetical protein IIX01_02555 [Clostridia bacterium]|nr:hypothetical protein [Clostridia bacterium]
MLKLYHSPELDVVQLGTDVIRTSNVELVEPSSVNDQDFGWKWGVVNNEA